MSFQLSIAFAIFYCNSKYLFDHYFYATVYYYNGSTHFYVMLEVKLVEIISFVCIVLFKSNEMYIKSMQNELNSLWWGVEFDTRTMFKFVDITPSNNVNN